jgi:hypothetical protein
MSKEKGEHTSHQTEPYSIMTPYPGELYYIERHIFLECVGERDAEEFVKTRPLIPADKALRVKHY